MSQDLSLAISKIVATGLDQAAPAGIAPKLAALFPGDWSAEQKARALAEAVVYSLQAARPGYAGDGAPGYLSADIDLKAAILNEIDAMMEADFDSGEHAAAWRKLKSDLDASPESEFVNGVSVTCPDDYILTLDRLTCAEALRRQGINPDF